MKHTLLYLIVFLLIGAEGPAQSNFWRQVDQSQNGRNDRIGKEQRLALDARKMNELLNRVPHESAQGVHDSPVTLTIPLPDGGFQSYRIVRYDLIDKELAGHYPELMTGYGIALDGSGDRIRFDWTARGFGLQAQSSSGMFYVERAKDSPYYVAFYKKDRSVSPRSFTCQMDEVLTELKSKGDPVEKSDDCRLSIYRLAIATTGEYANYHGAYSEDDSELLLSAIIRTINRVNGIYEVDLGVRLSLVPDLEKVLFYDPATDPFLNNSPLDLIRQNQRVMDDSLGNDGYDIGHVFGTGGGGFAALGVACRSGSKAQGQTGLPQPEGDIFYIDYVAHELGHQLGASHTFNGDAGNCNGQRIEDSAYEPGSGSTIMSYAGICAGQNLQLSSDGYFHGASIAQIRAFVDDDSRGGSCAFVIPSPDQPPTVDAGADVYVPAGTPFVLEAEGNDPEGFALSYCWEQWDPEFAPITPPQPENRIGPLFRSLPPQQSPRRYFPRLSDLSSGQTSAWEVLPAVDRSATFRVTVRESVLPVCTAYDEVTLHFLSKAGPFRVLPLDPPARWREGQIETVRWDVAGTDQPPIAGMTVDILLSYDGGLSFPVMLAAGLPNNGLAVVAVPAGTTDQARIMVRSADNVFFAISDEDFTIRAGSPDYGLSARPYLQSICAGADATLLYQLDVTVLGDLEDVIKLSVNKAPAGTVVNLQASSVPTGGNTVVEVSSLSHLPAGQYSFRIQGKGNRGNKSIELLLQVEDRPAAPVLASPINGITQQSPFPLLEWEAVATADAYAVQVATDAGFNDIIEDQITYVPRYMVKTILAGDTHYYWRVRPANECAAGPWSPVFNFKTAACRIYSSTDVPLLIPSAGPATIRSEIALTDEGEVLDVNVIDLRGTHSWIHDLAFTLTSPAGTERSLLEDICDNEDDFFLSLDDQAGDEQLPCPPTDGQAYRPLSSLSPFNGESAAGIWTLKVSDRFTQDGGSLDAWSLQVCIATSSALPVSWLSFRARPLEDRIQLDWSTANEHNNKGFAVQRRSETETAFQEIGWVDGRGQSVVQQDYTFTDQEVVAGERYYYRLRQLDHDGQEQFSDMVTALLSATHTSVWRVTPNPAAEQVRLYTADKRSYAGELEIYDMNGRRLSLMTIPQVLDIQSWPPGVYLLRLPTHQGWQWERLSVVR